MQFHGEPAYGAHILLSVDSDAHNYFCRSSYGLTSTTSRSSNTVTPPKSLPSPGRSTLPLSSTRPSALSSRYGLPALAMPFPASPPTPGFLYLPRVEAVGSSVARCARVGRGDRARRVLYVGRRAPGAGRRPRIRVHPLAGRSCPHPVHVCAYRSRPAAA
jgi:hypothetical protein